jgi:UDPglucose 6-dehydrogenase/GDP-mannose 6-dehydrogenase
MKVAIIGTGYVGLVSGVCLAEKGHHVTCVDIDAAKVDRINRGDAPIHADGLLELLQRNVGHRLRATLDLEAAVTIDLSYIREAAGQIGRALASFTEPHVVVV